LQILLADSVDVGTTRSKRVAMRAVVLVVIFAQIRFSEGQTNANTLFPLLSGASIVAGNRIFFE